MGLDFRIDSFNPCGTHSADIQRLKIEAMRPGPIVLAVDISSSGVTAGRFAPDLSAASLAATSWDLIADAHGSATLSPARLWEDTVGVIRACVSESAPPAALVLSSMMHTLLVVEDGGPPRCPVYTWRSGRCPTSMSEVEQSLGDDYTARTGAYFHPSFPAFRLARLQRETPAVLEPRCHIGSAKAWIGAKLTGRWREDVSTASASGLLNLATATWDDATVGILGVSKSALGTLTSSTDLVGHLMRERAHQLDLPEGLPIVTGGGDGFLANRGSGCEGPERTAITLGTTAAVRRFSPLVEIDAARGTFCYRYSDELFLIGAASNNGGNVLDWARQELKLDKADDSPTTQDLEAPLFLPFLNGERTPFWDPTKRPRWVHGGGRFTAGTLGRSVVEGLAFQLAIYFELVNPPPSRASMAVLSGNAFQEAGLANLLAAVLPVPLVEPHAPGLATLRGAARCGFEALGISTDKALEHLLATARTIRPNPDPHLDERYRRYKAVYFDRS